MSSRTALVFRATGAQGKGVVHHLAAADWKVRALVTDSSTERAAAVKSFGANVTLHQGTWKDPSSIEQAMKGCQALFFNQLPSFTDDSEVQEAKVVLDLAKKAGIEHIVFPSTLPLNNPNFREDLKDNSSAPAVVNKADVEELIKASGITWTFLRPGLFMTNFLPPMLHWMFPEMEEDKFVNSYGPDCILGLVDPDDIGAFAAAALGDLNRSGGQIMSVVSQNIRVDDLIKELRKAIGTEFEVVYRSPEESDQLKTRNPFVAGQLLCIGLDKVVDMDEVRGWGIPLTDFNHFVNKHNDAFRQISIG